MLPLIYHLQKVSFVYGQTNFSYFVIAQHPDHAREVLVHYLEDFNDYYDIDIFVYVRDYSSVQFIATLVNNENIHACVLEV